MYDTAVVTIISAKGFPAYCHVTLAPDRILCQVHSVNDFWPGPETEMRNFKVLCKCFLTSSEDERNLTRKQDSLHCYHETNVISSAATVIRIAVSSLKISGETDPEVLSKNYISRFQSGSSNTDMQSSVSSPVRGESLISFTSWILNLGTHLVTLMEFLFLGIIVFSC